jgi:hypothetical protein
MHLSALKKMILFLVMTFCSLLYWNDGAIEQTNLLTLSLANVTLEILCKYPPQDIMTITPFA